MRINLPFQLQCAHKFHILKRQITIEMEIIIFCVCASARLLLIFIGYEVIGMNMDWIYQNSYEL